MPSFFSNRRLIVLLVSTILMVVVVGLTLEERSDPSLPEQFVRDSTGFFQSLVYRPAAHIAGLFEDVKEIRQVYSENRRLKAQLQDHARLMSTIRELERENESLKKIHDVQDDLSEFNLRPALVINRSPDRWYQQLTINRGSRHGLKANMAVLTADGYLAGRIQSVTPFHAVVELISDVNRVTQISAVVQGEEQVYGVLDGFDVDKGALHFRMIDKDAPLAVGQTVVTYGLGGVFPRGLYVGKVIETIEDDFGLTQSALVDPAADLYDLDYVFVVEQTGALMLDDDIEENEDS